MKFLPKIPRLQFLHGAQPIRRPSLVAVDRHHESSEPFLGLRDSLYRQLAATPGGHDPASTNAAPRKGVIAILSPDAGDGRTYVALNLAAALAHDGVDTLLVGADTRSPDLGRPWQAMGGAPGLGQPSAGTGPDPRPIAEVPRLHLSTLDASAVGSSPSIDGSTWSRFIDEQRKRFDFIVLDTPPAASATDALVLAERCDFVVIVGRRGASRMSDLQRLVQRAARTKARLCGMVLNEA